MMKCCLCKEPMYLWQKTMSRATIAVHHWCFFMLQSDEEFEECVFGMDVDRGDQLRAEWEKYEVAREKIRKKRTRR